MSAILAQAVLAGALCASPSPAPVTEIGRTAARTRAANAIGSAPTSSSGVVTQAQIAVRPLQRPADVIETIPGAAVTQHSGEGKANQYFLRGFDLDHGTDLASSVAGIPVNLPTHAHGQGYADLNWVIPELVSYAEFKKGPYFADEGDFSAAGAVNLFYRDTIPSTVSASAGSAGNARLFLAGSPRLGAGTLLYGLEYVHDDNGFRLPDNYRRYNAVLRYSRVAGDSELAVTGTMYHGVWNASDQIPRRALAAGLLAPFDTLDPTDGGSTNHAGLALTYEEHRGTSATRYAAYALRYGLDLFSNFTYALDDPVNGDQIHQADRRFVFGAAAAREITGVHGTTTLGIGFRNDNIGTVELSHTRARTLIAPAYDPDPGDVRPVSDDHVAQRSAFAYVEHAVRIGERLRIVPGIRADVYRFRVAGEAGAGGTAAAGIVSPKLRLAFEATPRFELYADAGEGFHSNDARGTVGRGTPLARAAGAELGGRYESVSRTTATLTFWQLDLASELTFNGDQGTTSPGFPTRRKGVEFSTTLHPAKRVGFDLQYAASTARYTRFTTPVAGPYVAGAPSIVVTSGMTYDRGNDWVTLRYRYFGPRALVEDGSVRSAPTATFNLVAGRRPARTNGLAMQVEILNLFDRRADDVAYYYSSRLKGETMCPDGSDARAGCTDLHVHPLQRRAIRIALTSRR